MLVIALDAEARVALMNRKAAALAHTLPEHALGQPFLETWIPRGDRSSLRAALLGHRDHEIETGFGDLSQPALSRRRIRWHISR